MSEGIDERIKYFNMKKIFCFLLFIGLSFVLSACDNRHNIKEGIIIEKIEVIPTKEVIEVDEETTLEVRVYPEGLTNLVIVFSSNTTEIISVIQNGVVKGLMPGIAEIKVTVEEYEEIATIEVVEPTLKISNIPSSKLRIGEEITLKANKDVVWETSNEMIATVNENGVVKAKAPGEVEMIATAQDEVIKTKIVVEEMSYLDTPISYVYDGMLPSVGSPMLLVLLIEFPDARFAYNITKEYIDEIFFGKNIDYQTVSSFYYYSSYGRLQLDGEVLDVYRTKRNSSYYENEYYDYALDAILKEAINYYNPVIDYSKFDSNNDGYIDNVVVIYSKDYDYYSDIWWAYNVDFDDPDTYYEGPDLQVDGVYVNNCIWASAEFLFENDYNGKDITTFIHELGHSFGLDDYYDYDERGGPKGGLGGADLMDDTVGDHNSFSKYLLGWVDPIIVDLSKITSTTITIESFVHSGDFILITNDAREGVFSEYILVEYYTPDSLNSSNFYLTTDGVRIFHVDAILGDNKGDYITAFRYDNSDESKKLIRLVEADGGNDIEENYEAENSDLFQEKNTYRIDINKNFELVIEKIENDRATITIEQIN